MSGLRRLFREAGRAGAFMRRLDRSLEPARLVTSRSGDWALVRVDERIASLTDTVDPFARLASVLARIGTKQVAEEREPRIVRRLDAGAHAFSARRAAGRADVAPSERRVAPSANRATTWQTSDTVVPPEFRANPVSAREPAGETSVRVTRHRPGVAPSANRATTRQASDPVVRPEFRANPVSAREPAGETSVRVTRHRPGVSVFSQSRPVTADWGATEQHSVRAPGPSQTAGDSKPAAADAYGNPSRAADIFIERMRAANTLDAFRTVIRISSSVQPDREPKCLSSGVDRPHAGSRSQIGEALMNRVPDTAGAGVEPAQQTLPEPASLPQASDLRTEEGHDPSPLASAPIREMAPRGLRRLAALATESLDEPRPAVGPVPSSEPVVRLDEELDRILRTEALRYGIGADGLVR